MAKKKEVKSTRVMNGILVPGCMFVGIGIGMLIGNTGALTVIGLGVGFLCMYWANNCGK